MNVIDKMVGFFAPNTALKRVRARYAIRAYEGAAGGRRATSWRATGTSANTELANSIAELRNRARALVRNTPHATRMLDVIVSHAIGTGIHPVPNTGSPQLDKKLTNLWNDWQAKADVEGLLSFYSMQTLLLRSTIESGETVLRFIQREKNFEGMEVPLQLQLLEGDFIDDSRDGLFAIPGQTSPDTKRSRLGIGLGDYDKRTGLWLLPYHPGETVTMVSQQFISSFHGNSEQIHFFRPQRPGQVRGVSWFAPILMTARDLADFMDAVTVKARVEACFAAFVLNNDEFEDVMDVSAGDIPPSANNPDASMTTMEPGMIKNLRQGQDVKFAQPTSTTQVDAILMYNMMAQAAGVGCTYDQTTGDLRQANYSSLRAGGLIFKKLVEQLQYLWLIPNICEPVWNKFISSAIISGALQSREGGFHADWVTTAWEPVNPKFDLDSEERSVRAGRMSPKEFIATWGQNWKKVIDDWAEFNKYCDEKGVVLDIDPRRTTRNGQAQKISTKPDQQKQPAADEGKKPGEEKAEADEEDSGGQDAVQNK